LVSTIQAYLNRKRRLHTTAQASAPVSLQRVTNIKIPTTRTGRVIQPWGMHLTFSLLIQTLKMQIHICTLASLDLDASTSRSVFAALTKDDQLLKTLYDIFLPETRQGNHIVWALCLNSLSSGGEPNITLLRRMSD